MALSEGRILLTTAEIHISLMDLGWLEWKSGFLAPRRLGA